MALEGLLAKLGPTVVREVTPHLLQLVSGFIERFRSDTREMKAAVDAEVASLTSSHAGLVTSIDQQRDRLEAAQSHLTAVERKIDRLQDSVDTLSRQLAAESARSEALQRTTRVLAGTAAACALLAFILGVVALVHHR